MGSVDSQVTRPRRRLGLMLTGVALILGVVALPTWALAANPLMPSAASPPTPGTWSNFALLSNTGVTNTGPSVVQGGDIGSSGTTLTAITGFPPGIHTGNLVAGGAATVAQTDATRAVNDLEGQRLACTTISGDLGGRVLVPGVYCFSAGLTGTLVLNAGADPNAIFIFLGSDQLIVNTGAAVVLIGSSSCNVYWRAPTLASLNTSVSFIGTIFAGTQVTMASGAKLSGRAIAQTANVTLIDNAITSSCVAGASTATPTSASTATATRTPTSTAIVTRPPATQTAIVAATQTAVIPATQTAVIPSTQTAVAAATQTAVAAFTHTATAVPSGPPPSCVGNIRGSKVDGSGHGLAGWTVQLLQGGQVIQTTVTDAAGNFSFLGLPMGTYTVQEVPQAGWTAQSPTSITVSITGCDQNLTGFTFVNVSGSGSVSQGGTAVPGTPTVAGAGLTPTRVGVSTIPSVLPRSGDSIPGAGAFALILGALALGAGLVAVRARK